MSDESTASAAAINALPPSDEAGPSAALRDVLPSAIRRSMIKRQKSSFNQMRAYLLDDLAGNLDVLIYVELSTIYYLDCYIFRLLLRCIVQFMFLTPKPALFPALPKPEPFVGAIVGTNLLCLILHIFSAAPSAGESTRFYLHGGLLIDFIGQRGPTSKLLLIGLDLFVLVLQLIHLSAHVTIRRLREESKGSVVAATTYQDLDSEERGVRRSVELAQEQVQDGIELQTLNPSGSTSRVAHPHTTDSAEDTTATEPQQEFEDRPRPESALFDAFKNGQIVVADLNILRTVKEQVLIFRKTSPEVRRNALSAHLAGRMAGLRMLTGRTQ